MQFGLRNSARNAPGDSRVIRGIFSIESYENKTEIF